MGIVCEMYRVKDEKINFFIQNPDKADEYFYDNYSCVYGKYHIESEYFFYLDKVWQIAFFLFQENDTSEGKVLSKLKGHLIDINDWDTPHYLMAWEVKEMNEIMQSIKKDDLIKAHNSEKMIEKDIYRAKLFSKNTDSNYWNYLFQHIESVKLAFLTASNKSEGLVINFC